VNKLPRTKADRLILLKHAHELCVSSTIVMTKRRPVTFATPYLTGSTPTCSKCSSPASEKWILPYLTLILNDRSLVNLPWTGSLCPAFSSNSKIGRNQQSSMQQSGLSQRRSTQRQVVDYGHFPFFYCRPYRKLTCEFNRARARLRQAHQISACYRENGDGDLGGCFALRGSSGGSRKCDLLSGLSQGLVGGCSVEGVSSARLWFVNPEVRMDFPTNSSPRVPGAKRPRLLESGKCER
jgi:hypothetical protein